MKKAQFTKLVLDELHNIKRKATKEEIERLDFSKFDYASPDFCIYGQMTGFCCSERASEITPKSFAAIQDFNDLFNGQYYVSGNTFTALEKYLYMCNSEMHKKIIQYLKDEVQEIKLTYRTK